MQLLVERTRKLGVEVHLETELVAVDSSGNSFTVQASTPDEGRSFEADLVVHGAGRIPDLDELDLDKAGVEHDRRGVKVNEYLQSVSNPCVYAAGDAAASGPPLTPVASYDGDIVAANLIDGNHRKVEYRFYQKDGKPDRVEVYLVTRNRDLTPKKPKTLSVKWPFDRPFP